MRDDKLMPAKSDYRYCETCSEFFDLWKYDSIADTGHEGHKLREPTDEEYKQLLKDCEEAGCFEELFWRIRMSVQKLGVLRKNTVIHTEGDITFKVEKGTIVVVSSDTLRFRDKDLVAYREGDGFYVRSDFSRTPHRVIFPDGGVPYPFTML